MINTLFGTLVILLIVVALLFIAILINDIIEKIKRTFRGEK